MSFAEIGAAAAIVAMLLAILRFFGAQATKKDISEIKSISETIRTLAIATNGRVGRLEEWRTMHDKASDVDHTALDGVKMAMAALITPSPVNPPRRVKYSNKKRE